MADKKIFCNVPWTNLHIYWDGSYGACCSESDRIYNKADSEKYNLKNMTVDRWFNEEPMINFRKNILGTSQLPACSKCYFEEDIGYESRRIKENFKSVIFTKDGFDKSYQQSHWNSRFESGARFQHQKPPIDWHVDLGNECNLSCKMCWPAASSQIASKYKTWGIEDYKPSNWVDGSAAYQNFIDSIKICKPTRIHFMGGEPMISKKFKLIIDHLIETKQHKDISISFVTNGTIQDLALIKKLKTFKSFDIEISIESVTDNNHYIRQGSNTAQVLENILTLKEMQDNNFHVVLRSVPQLLNINNYNEYIKWAWNHKLPIQGIPLVAPSYLSVKVLPLSLRKTLVDRYVDLVHQIKSEANRSINELTTGRDSSRLDIQLINECQSMIVLLQEPEPENVEQLRQELCEWLIRWDKAMKLDARDFYPEYAEFLDMIGYDLV